MWRCVINNQSVIFNKFIETYPIYERYPDIIDESWRLRAVSGVKNFYENFSGSVFGKGIYRLLLSSEIEEWNCLVLSIFRQFEKKIECFATDWMGRVFAWDFYRQQVVLFDPAFGEALKIPCDFVELHNQEFVDYAEEALSLSVFQEFTHKHQLEINRVNCVGYKKSPFLGGFDNIDNMEVIDLEIYWSICSEIYNQIKEK